MRLSEVEAERKGKGLVDGWGEQKRGGRKSEEKMVTKSSGERGREGDGWREQRGEGRG